MRTKAPRELLAVLREHLYTPTAKTISTLKQWGVTPLSGGRNNHAFRWVGPTGTICIKLYRVDKKQRDTREWAALQVLARRGLETVPRPLWYDANPDAPAIGMTFVPGKRLTTLKITPHHLHALADTLRELHSITPTPGLDDLLLLRDSPPASRINRIMNWVETLQRQDSAGWNYIAPFFRKWHDSSDGPIVAQEPSLTFTRGDPNLENCLWDGERVRLVDFEYAGWSDLAFECADMVEHVRARQVEDKQWVEVIRRLARVDAAFHGRFLACQRTLALWWVATLWPVQSNRYDEVSMQLRRVQMLQRGGTVYETL